MSCTPCTGRFERIYDNGREHVKDLATGETYDPDEKCLLGLKFIQIVTIGHLLFPLHLIRRFVDLFQLNFYHCGKATAEQNFFRNTTTGTVVPIKDIIIESIKELAIRVLKIALLPLGFIAKDLSSLIGLVVPYQGRKCISKIDQFFYVRPKNMFAEPSSLPMELTYFSATCMLTSQFRKQENIFRFNFLRDAFSFHLEFQTLLKNASYLNLNLTIPKTGWINWNAAIIQLNILIEHYKKTRVIKLETLQFLRDTLKSANGEDKSDSTHGGDGVTNVPTGSDEL